MRVTMNAGDSFVACPGPRPDGGALTVRVPCRTTANPHIVPALHEVRVLPDWTIEVPHDLDSERIAAAFGGHLSCLGVVDDAPAALRFWLAANLRVGPPLYAIRDGQWTVADRASCCRETRFPGAADAARHARSVPHAANRYGAEVDGLLALAAAVRRAYGDRFDLDPADPAIWRATAACRGGMADVEYLFACGITPTRVASLHIDAVVDGPLPRAYFVTAAIDACDGTGCVTSPDLHPGPADGSRADLLTDYVRRRALSEGTS